MRVRSAALLSVIFLALTGCDKVYFARLDVGAYATPQTAVAALTPAERERALSVIRTTANELGLRCTPSEYPIISNSYDSDRYKLTSCRAEGQFTQVQLADSPTHITLEIQHIGGIGEPAFFRKCRTQFAEALEGALPSHKVTIRYPYHWGPKERGQS